MNLTIDMLEQMDSQDVFDVAAWHMLRQGMRACGPDGCCLYRGPAGQRCAVGWLIPDSMYSPAMEDKCVECVAHLPVWTDAGHRFTTFLRRHLPLLAQLQRIHDRHDPACWPELLVGLASRFGLRPQVVEHGDAVSRVVLRERAPVPRTTDLSVTRLLLLTFTEAGRVRREREETPEAACA